MNKSHPMSIRKFAILFFILLFYCDPPKNKNYENLDISEFDFGESKNSPSVTLGLSFGYVF